MNEHESEPVRGLPEQLPAGETILWQGTPRWGVLARRTFHTRKVAAYFALLLAWLVYADIADGIPGGQIALSSLWLVVGGAVAIGLLSALAWLLARSAIYTITNRRVVMRFGVALTMAFNFPFRRIRAVGLRLYSDGSGDLPISLFDGDRIAYLVLWPHARPWHFAPSQPMLRGVVDAQRVAEILSRAIADEMLTRTPATPAQPTAANPPSQAAA